MAKIVECVPNFSEGRDRGVIKRLTDAIESVDGVTLKDVDPGVDTNRVVVTFVGPPEPVLEAAFSAIARAAEIIDMRKHKGAHPRMGATDVCPFVPVKDVTMEECVELAKRLGARVGRDLGIPVYLYEHAASRPERMSLAAIRRGEYEALPAKLADPEWRPDFGPAVFNAKSGASAIGARQFLIAYNINLNSRSKDHATDIAFELRDKGRSARCGNVRPFYYRGELLKHQQGRFICGSCELPLARPEELFEHTRELHGYDYRELAALHDHDPDALAGQSSLRPGLFRHCRAIGWEVPQYGRAQISINLTDYNVTPPHIVLDKARELALERGLVVTGSEIVGLVPLPAMLQAGRYYLERQRRSTGIPIDDILETAVQSMGLRDVAPFDIREKVIGYEPPDPASLIDKKVHELVHEVSRESPAPGGGSVAALAGSLGAALASMVCNLTTGKAGYEAVWEEMNRTACTAQALKQELLAAVDEDTRAFAAYMGASRMPKGTADEKAARELAMQEGLRKAVAVPLATAEQSLQAMEVARLAAENGNKTSVSDAGVGAQMGFAGVQGGLMNVRINLGGITDEAFVREMTDRCKVLGEQARVLLEEVIQTVYARMSAS